MLHRAELIELAGTGAGREKPYRPVAKHLKVGTEIRAAGLASELQAAQLQELTRGFERHAATGDFRSAQIHVKLAPDSVRDELNALIDRLSALEDEAEPQQTVTLAFHPAIPEGDTDPARDRQLKELGDDGRCARGAVPVDRRVVDAPPDLLRDRPAISRGSVGLEVHHAGRRRSARDGAGRGSSARSGAPAGS